MYTQERVDKKNKITTNRVDGIVYDSILEAQEASNLTELKKKDEIKDFTRQFKLDFFIVKRKLGEDETKTPVLVCNPEDDERRYGLFMGRYYMDFRVVHNDDTIELIEVKGIKGKDWKIKWNMTEAVFGMDPNYFLKIKV